MRVAALVTFPDMIAGRFRVSLGVAVSNLSFFFTFRRT